ncbi:hypothetical protein AMATHDRAFT_48851 [Amanita thiersii Skay4041]|uniref:Uncharacterized protein n=1 Tax=Amanita thiersii Skay4041 TaxID=703135 RepID=A0A2A9NDY9_9AGAR|nr:hypothetical protein AMATHDRAFT_48851 [Amanita thiersii Skay4041]
MGKWTPDYLDDVLHAKITTLVTGAIQRAALDKMEPAITYENFVKDLDTGDSFTTSFVDILVKEMAERRTRPNTGDRRLIADRTAKSLRLLATPLRIYRERPVRNFPPRRTVSLSDYLSAPPNEMDLAEDEDDLEGFVDTGTYSEGTRLNQELYDAYGLWPTRRLFSSSPSPPAEESGSGTMPPPPNVSRHGTWSNTPATTTSLRRQPSIRLSARSRTVDFNDFTSRRRSSIRESRPDANVEGSPDGRESAFNRDARTVTRRFFPFSRNRRHDVVGNLIPSDGEAPGGDGADEGVTYIFEPSVSGAAWFPLTSPARSASPPDYHDSPRSSAETSDERAQVVPRLRRGGVRAPEAIFSRYDVPAPQAVPASPLSETSEHTSNHRLPPVTGPSSYPTPGPTENEEPSSST